MHACTYIVQCAYVYTLYTQYNGCVRTCSMTYKAKRLNTEQDISVMSNDTLLTNYPVMSRGLNKDNGAKRVFVQAHA